jgi:hypothetical protein
MKWPRDGLTEGGRRAPVLVRGGWAFTLKEKSEAQTAASESASAAALLALIMPDDALELQDRLIRAMTPERKLQISEQLRRAAWELKAAWIRDQHPRLTEEEVQARVRAIFRDARS